MKKLTSLLASFMALASITANAGIEGIFHDADDPSAGRGIYYQWNVDGYDLPGAQFGNFKCDITALFDPVRLINSPDVSAYAFGGLKTESTETPYPAYITGGLGYVSCTTPGSPQPGIHCSFAPKPAWPAHGTVKDGYYNIKFTVNDLTTHTANVNAWLIGGVWSLSAPPSPPAAGSVDGSGGASGTDVGALRVYVYYTAGTNQSTLPLSGAVVTVTGPQLATQTTDTTGKTFFNPVLTGSYIVKIAGTHTGTTGSTVTDLDTRQVQIPPSATAVLTVTLGDNGKFTYVSGGQSTDNANGGWLQDTLKYLFVPQQSKVDAFKSNLSSFTNWGPFTLISDLNTAMTTPASGTFTVTIPAYFWDTSTNPAHWRVCDGCTTSNIDISGGITSVSSWALVRTLMGAFVWFTFVFCIAKILMPKQVI